MAAVSPVHKSSFGWSKSKSLLGCIGPLDRARVMDLWSDDPDKGPSPPQRVLGLKRQHLSGGWPALFRPNSVEYEQLGKSWNPWWKDCLPTDPRCSWWTLHRRGAYYLQLWFQSGYYPAEVMHIVYGDKSEL